MKKISDLQAYKNVLPYSSEIFGIYQPLLGWKSKRTIDRVYFGYMRDKGSAIDFLKKRFRGVYRTSNNEGSCNMEILNIMPGKLAEGTISSTFKIIESIKQALPPEEQLEDQTWKDVLSEHNLERLLNGPIREHYQDMYLELCRQFPEDSYTIRAHTNIKPASEIISELLNEESSVSGVLTFLSEHNNFKELKEIFYGNKFSKSDLINDLLKSDNPFDYIDPKKDLARVGLSPIGIVHLFRQYFFELDTFLGTPVNHIWLSPGASVELVEVSTRKTIEERYVETATESIIKTEKSITEQDDISDAVKQDNKTETKFGINVNASQKWVWGSATESASFDLNNTQSKAREESHKHMRQQSEKLSTEIRTNYKSSFKTITEVTDTSSKRYVLSNTTDNLINYELRRKMRQVGVQVQDVGTYLCWQTYVDHPGKQLGVAKMVHLAKPADIDNIPQPDKIIPPKPIHQDIPIQIPFINLDSASNDDEFTHGSETSIGFADKVNHIESNHVREVICEQANYILKNVVFDTAGSDAKVSLKDNKIEQDSNSNKARFTVHLDYINFHGQDNISINANLLWEPVFDQQKIHEENEKNLKNYTAKVEYENRKAFITAAKERIKQASNLEPRKFDELREEERIVVYRILIQDMLMKGISMPNQHTRHVVSELINSIFDVDKMLYFVAPEWWKPRMHKSSQSLGGNVTETEYTDWGGVGEKARSDNYHITNDSKPAKFGSSLGWLLQLDGDNQRNTFLNAPWVKAVIPIRPGKEKAAINWLKQVEGMNGISDTDMYAGNEADLQGKSMTEVLNILAERVANKHKEALQTKKIPDPANPLDESLAVSATPVDKVYEHGFYPLQGGFRVNVNTEFEVFDQWIEILPTDQIVAVEVKYDPKTGRQI